MRPAATRTIAHLFDSVYSRPSDLLSWTKGSKHANSRTGKSGGPRIDRQEKRKRKIAEASKRRNRKS